MVAALQVFLRITLLALLSVLAPSRFVTTQFVCVCVTIYRPPNSVIGFLDEFSERLSSLVVNFDRVIIVGDFNIHFDTLSNSFAQDFLNICNSFNFVQHVVSRPTHNHGHTLDLVLTLDLPLNSLNTNDFASDHKIRSRIFQLSCFQATFLI